VPTEPTVRKIYSMPRSLHVWIEKQAAKLGVSAAQYMRQLVEDARKAVES